MGFKSFYLEIRIDATAGCSIDLGNEHYTISRSASLMGKCMVELGNQQYIVGRAAESDITFSNCPRMSREHFKLVLTPPNALMPDFHYQLIDSSRNGTFVNGAKVSRLPLRNGDLIVFGGCGEFPQITFVEIDADTPDEPHNSDTIPSPLHH